MADVNHWDFAEVFTAVQAALLIEAKDPAFVGTSGRNGRWDQNVSDVILSRMRDDYADTFFAYALSDDIDGPRELLPWENKLPSSMMNIMAKDCFKFGKKAEFKKWLADGDKTSFEKQSFTRKDLQYWLDANHFPSKYQFENKAAPATEPLSAKSELSSGWPWGNHHTELLGHLEATARKFWVNYDPTDATTAPVNKNVAEWLRTERKVSQKMAEAIASMLRPDDLPTGPRK
ncbi:hypothetical protein [Rhodoferax sp.]|uniref:hypothetical protein n=1 Tax=Rhodoferax sp. TaxID=50421 RepID=UPI00284E86B0|nr:hypothetical protein [Rhodoferax sp.]MDR3369061.1 hypothetical protein [Rhodoferax sp.]